MYTEPANIKWNLFNKRTKYSNFPGDGTMMHLKGLASVLNNTVLCFRIPGVTRA